MSEAGEVLVSLPRPSASALLAVASAYAADEAFAGSPLSEGLDRAIQPLRDVLTREEAQAAHTLLTEAWSS